MMEATMQTASILETPYYCKIEVRGHLDCRAAGGFNGLTVEHDDGATVLEGLIRNQIDLCDYILRLHNLNLPVASLSYSEIGEDDAAAELS
jgi:hypothetical protein